MHEEFLKYLKKYNAGKCLIQEGNNDTDFFCLLKGKVGIWKGEINEADKNKVNQIGEISEKGTYFGEMSSLIHEKRTASITAIDEVKVLKFPGEMLSEIILKEPKLGLNLLRSLAQRLKGSTDQQQTVATQRNEIREDATEQLLDAKESFQKIFIMLSAAEAQLRNPLIKSIVQYMATSKLLQGGRKINFNRELLTEIPQPLVEIVKKVYADNFTE